MACQHRCEVDRQKAGDSFSRWQEQYEELRNDHAGKGIQRLSGCTGADLGV